MSPSRSSLSPHPDAAMPMSKQVQPKVTIDPGFLKRHGLFAGLAEEDLKDLPVLFRIEEFKRGERIISEGERGGSLYVIYQGGVDIMKKIVSREGECQEKIASLHT